MILPLLLLCLQLFSESKVIDSIDIQVNNNILENVSALTSIESLNISYLNLNDINPGAFSNVIQMKSLDCSNNNLQYLHSNVFDKVNNLEVLSLARNNLRGIPRNLFSQLKKLKKLDLSENKLLKVDHETFYGLQDDVDISIHGDNSIEYLQPVTFIEDKSGEKNLRTCENNRNIQYDNILALIENHKKENNCIFNATNNSRSMMICITAEGIVQSVESSTEIIPPNCSILNNTGVTLVLENSDIRGFAKNWYHPPQDRPISAIVITGTQIAEINENILNDLPPCIYQVAIANNRIKTIRSNVMKADNIYHLNLQQNSIETIESEAFKDFKVLSTLFLINNSISDIEFVRNLPNTVTSLYMGFNNVPNIPEGTFSNLPELAVLDFDCNTLTYIGEVTFRNLSKLVRLRMTNNSIEKIDKDTFNGAPCLLTVNLNENHIKSIEKGFARNLNEMSFIDIRNNSLEHLKNGMFYGMPRFGIVKFNNIKSVQSGIFKEY